VVTFDAKLVDGTRSALLGVSVLWLKFLWLPGLIALVFVFQFFSRKRTRTKTMVEFGAEMHNELMDENYRNADPAP